MTSRGCENEHLSSKGAICSWARIPVAMLLLIAVGLKSWYFHTSPGSTESTASRAIWIVVLFVEFSTAIAIILEFRAPLVRILSGGLFIVFTIFNLAQWIFGETHCRCLGSLELHPGIMVVIDVLALICLFVWRPLRSIANRHFDGHVLTLMGSLYIAFLAIILGAVSQMFGDRDEDGLLRIGRNSIVVDSTNWNGKRFPLLAFIDNRNAIERGTWEIVVVHSDCPKCRDLLSSLEKVGEEKAVAVIEIPSAPRFPPQFARSWPWFRLDDSITWYVETPSHFRLENGIVVGQGGG
jgi:hypothetical protein